jgi:hypothetical protein
MKKLGIVVLLAIFAMSAQGQSNAMKQLINICEACNDGTASVEKGCRAIAEVCYEFEADSDIAAKVDNKQIKRIAFAYQSTEMLVGLNAKVEIIDKKGNVLHTATDGVMVFLDKDENVRATIGTSVGDARLRQLGTQELAFFTFPMSVEFKKRDKVKAKVTISKLNMQTREMEVVTTFEERVK